MTLQQTIPDMSQVLGPQPAVEVDLVMAADAFAGALGESSEFIALLAAAERLRADTEANAAIAAFGQRQAELRMPSLLGTLSDAERADLEALQTAMLACPVVSAYLAAQDAFQAVCIETSDVISGQIGIDFAANARSGGCCG